MSPRSGGPGDMLARMRAITAAGSEAPPEPAPAPRRRPAVTRQQQPSSPPAAPRERRRSTRDQEPPELAGFDIRGAGGKRTVLYLPADVLDHLAAIQRAAEAQGGRLDRSAIVTQLVRRHRDGGR